MLKNMLQSQIVHGTVRRQKGLESVIGTLL